MKKPPIRILHVLWWGELGGTAGNLCDLVANLDQDRYSISVCFLNRAGRAKEFLERHNVEYFELGAKSGRDLVSIYRFMRLLRTQQYDVLHNHSRTYLATMAVAIAARTSTKICQEHGDVHALRAIAPKTLFYKLLNSVYDQYIAVSENTGNSMVNAGVKRERLHVLGNPVDVGQYGPTMTRAEAREELGLPACQFVVGTACRFSPEKDLELFLRTATLVHQQRKEVRFVLAGDGEHSDDLRRLSAELGLTDVVHFLGMRSDMPVVWRAFDIYLFTSLREAFSRTLIESQCAQTPSVSAIPLAGGAIEIIENSPGVVAIAKRSPEALANATLRLLDSEELRQQLGCSGQAWVADRFEVKEWTKRMAAIYQGLPSGGNDIDRKAGEIVTQH